MGTEHQSFWDIVFMLHLLQQEAVELEQSLWTNLPVFDKVNYCV